MLALVTHSCLTVFDPMDHSPPGSSVHGILQAKILEWVAIYFSRGSSQPRDRTQVSHIAGRCFNLWATGDVISVLKLIPWPPYLTHAVEQERGKHNSMKDRPRPLGVKNPQDQVSDPGLVCCKGILASTPCPWYVCWERRMMGIIWGGERWLINRNGMSPIVFCCFRLYNPLYDTYPIL